MDFLRIPQLRFQLMTEACVWRCSVEKVFLEFLEIHKKTLAPESLLRERLRHICFFLQNTSGGCYCNGTVKKYKSTVPSIFSTHALTGGDSGPKLYDIGKAKTINSLKSVTLSVFGNLESSKTECMDDVKCFIAKCFDVDSKQLSEIGK